MKKDIRIVSIADLVTDYYYLNNQIYGISGGMSSHNIIMNLANKGFKTATFGVSGNDNLGIIAKKSLEDSGVNTNYIIIRDDIETRRVHINCINNKEKHKITSELECPICHKINWYKSSMLDYSYILNNIKKNDILVFDSLNPITKKIIQNSKNIKLIDMGHIEEFKNITIDELRSVYHNQFEIININDKIYKYILKKYKLKNYEEFNNIFNSKLTIITKGKKGANFIYNNKLFEYKLENVTKEVDPTGAGDAFFASIISDFINNTLEIEETNLKTWFENATKITSEVVKQIGARAHIQRIYKIKKNNISCLCENFTINN